MTDVLLVFCNTVNNDYQQDWRVLYTFVPNKSSGQLLKISSSTSFIFLETVNSEFSYIKVWFTDQNSETLYIEDRINLTLVIKEYSYYKMRYSIEHRDIFVEGFYWFLTYAKK